MYSGVSGLVGGIGPPTNMPTNGFQCPPADEAGFPLDPEHSDTSSAPIHSEYPAPPGQVGVFYCEYSATTGVLVVDHDEGLCPAVAVPSSATRFGQP
jgi:hypothetical protein